MLYLALIFIIALGAYSIYASRKVKFLEREFISSHARATSLLAFADASTLIASSRNKISLIEALMDGAGLITGSKLAAVFLLEDGGFYSSLNRTEEALSGSLKETRAELERMAREAHAKKVLFPESTGPGIGYAMIIPLLLKDEVLGKLIVANKPGPYTEQAEDLLMSLGTQAALALKKLATESAVEGLATKDSLTGLFNHRAFQEKLDSELERAGRFSHNLSVLMIDIDDFKKFNSAYGREAGDAALGNIADIIRESTRGIDLAARYGGEEFVLLLIESSPEIALRTAERIREAVRAGDFNGGKLTVSIGVATYPADAGEKEELLKEADGALYIAKKRGKDKVISADKFSLA